MTSETTRRHRLPAPSQRRHRPRFLIARDDLRSQYVEMPSGSSFLLVTDAPRIETSPGQSTLRWFIKERLPDGSLALQAGSWRLMASRPYNGDSA